MFICKIHPSYKIYLIYLKNGERKRQTMLLSTGFLPNSHNQDWTKMHIWGAMITIQVSHVGA